MLETQNTKKIIKLKGFNSVYYFEFGKDFSHEPEAHDFWEMVYVDSGNILAVTEGVGINLTQGQAIFHKPMELHAHISDKKAPNNMVVISFTASGNAMEYFRGKTFTLDKTAKTLLTLFMEEAKNALGTIPNNYNDREDLCFDKEVFGASQLMECYFTEFLIKLTRIGGKAGMRLVSDEHSRNLAASSLSELIGEHMKKSIYGSLTLKELCSAFSMGKTKLCAIFSDNTGKSPMEYYNELKINEAKKLLREGSYSVSQIAEMLGYTTIHNFSRAFKKAAGQSPTAYVKRIL
jgi:AraC-like DNA-binding protein